MGDLLDDMDAAFAGLDDILGNDFVGLGLEDITVDMGLDVGLSDSGLNQVLNGVMDIASDVTDNKAATDNNSGSKSHTEEPQPPKLSFDGLPETAEQIAEYKEYTRARYEYQKYLDDQLRKKRSAELKNSPSPKLAPKPDAIGPTTKKPTPPVLAPKPAGRRVSSPVISRPSHSPSTAPSTQVDSGPASKPPALSPKPEVARKMSAPLVVKESSETGIANGAQPMPTISGPSLILPGATDDARTSPFPRSVSAHEEPKTVPDIPRSLSSEKPKLDSPRSASAAGAPGRSGSAPKVYSPQQYPNPDLPTTFSGCVMVGTETEKMKKGRAQIDWKWFNIVIEADRLTADPTTEPGKKAKKKKLPNISEHFYNKGSKCKAFTFTRSDLSAMKFDCFKKMVKIEADLSDWRTGKKHQVFYIAVDSKPEQQALLNTLALYHS